MQANKVLLQERLKYISDFFEVLMREDLPLLVRCKHQEVHTSDAMYQVAIVRNDGKVCSEVFRYVISKCLDLPTEICYPSWVCVADVCVEDLFDTFDKFRELPIGARQSLLQYMMHMFLRLEKIVREDVVSNAGVKGF